MAPTLSWIEGLWRSVIEETIDQAFREPEWADYPALGRLTITRPELLRPFAEHNRRHPDQAVRPHSFVSVAYQKPFARAEKLRLFAPFVAPVEALEAPWYELRSGERVSITIRDLRGAIDPSVVPVRSYGEIARAYADRPESKFLARSGGPCVRGSSGTLLRRHLTLAESEYLGKEGNLVEARVVGPGAGAENQLVYDDRADFHRYVVPELHRFPQVELAALAGISTRALRDVLSGRAIPRRRTEEALRKAARRSR